MHFVVFLYTSSGILSFLPAAINQKTHALPQLRWRRLSSLVDFGVAVWGFLQLISTCSLALERRNISTLMLMWMWVGRQVDGLGACLLGLSVVWSFVCLFVV